MEERTLLQTDAPEGYPPASDATRVMFPVAPAGPYGGSAGGYSDTTQQAITITCPVCQTPNGPGERYCQDCGLLFGSAPDEVEPLADASQLPRLVDPTGRELPLNPGVNSVGRETADVLVADPTVSRRHAQLTLEGNQILVEDFGSTNGTSVSGRKLVPGQRETALDGDTIKFGNVVLNVTIPGGPAAAPVIAPLAAAAPVEDRGPAVGRLVLADGTEKPLFAGVNVLGRRSSNQIVIPDAFASGKHAEITCDGDGTAHLVDLGSTNGTFVAGSRLVAQSPTLLTDGEVFLIGKAQVTYYRTEGFPPTPLEQPLLEQPILEQPIPSFPEEPLPGSDAPVAEESVQRG